MLPFSTASEPVEMLDETLQWKVSQCVVVVFSSFFLVQMPLFSAASEPGKMLDETLQ